MVQMALRSASFSTSFSNRWRWWLSDALVITKRNLLHIPRVPEQLAAATTQPILFVLLFRYVFGGVIHVGTTSYINFLMAGVFVQTMALGSVTTGTGLAEDLQRGLIDRFRSLPMARSAVLLGRTLADLVRNLVVVCILLLVGLLTGFRPQGSPLSWLACVGLLLLFSYAFSWIAATIGLLMRSVEAVQMAGLSWIFPLTFLSSAFVPTGSMPSWLQVFAAHQPVTVVINTVRGLLLGQSISASGGMALAWCLLILVFFMPLAVWLYSQRTAH
jgi:ABC transporter DrrB family efflux protein